MNYIGKYIIIIYYIGELNFIDNDLKRLNNNMNKEAIRLIEHTLECPIQLVKRLLQKL